MERILNRNFWLQNIAVLLSFITAYWKRNQLRANKAIAIRSVISVYSMAWLSRSNNMESVYFTR